MKGGANMYDTNINLTSENSTGNILKTGVGTVLKGITAYTNFWRNLAKKALGRSNTIEGNI